MLKKKNCCDLLVLFLINNVLNKKIFYNYKLKKIIVL